MELDVGAGFAKDEGAAGQLVELTAVGATQLEGGCRGVCHWKQRQLARQLSMSP